MAAVVLAGSLAWLNDPVLTGIVETVFSILTIVALLAFAAAVIHGRRTNRTHGDH